MASLANVGLQMEWAADGTLTFDPNIVVEETVSRPRERLRSVALEPDSCLPPDQVQYWMYNGLALKSDRERLAATGMRYELTLMFPRSLGREKAKTLGHLHSSPPQGRLSYPEICEVLHGTAYFVFQTMDSATRGAPFCGVVEVHAGEKVIIPPNLHHLTINAGDDSLLFADVIPLAARGIYQPLAAMHGAAHLYTDGGWIVNPGYTQVGTLQRWPVRDYPALNLTADRPLYRTFVENPEYLEWMVQPEHFASAFPDIWERIAVALAA
ncbi:MAG TPA: glucose-6-phosphate isomerase family protein [Aggregatilineales bacterium]|nr:glucose-6-phosphate isomerase family protein [Aggregatilineales bacterium]